MRSIFPPVPGTNSASNSTMADVIGSKTDTWAGTSVAWKTFSVEKHMHSVGKVYPTLASGVVVAGWAGARALSASRIEVVPANTITASFDIHFVTIESASADDVYELVLASGGAGSETEITRVRFVRDSVGWTKILQSVPVLTPVVWPNTRISAKLATATWWDSATISLQYHTY